MNFGVVALILSAVLTLVSGIFFCYSGRPGLGIAYIAYTIANIAMAYEAFVS